jgi:hypothetical protein
MIALSILMIIVEDGSCRTGTFGYYDVQIPLFLGGKYPSARTIIGSCLIREYYFSLYPDDDAKKDHQKILKVLLFG